jgi:hypothetical protein
MWSFHPIRRIFVLLLSMVCLSVRARGQAQQDAAQAITGTASSKQAAPAAASPGAKPETDAAEGYGNRSPQQDPGTTSSDTRPKEDWNALAIPHDLVVADAMPPLRGNFPDFTREFVQVEWRPSDVIDLYVMKPVGVKKPPVILYLYTFPGDTDRFKADEFARTATRNGFAAVGFVSALTGQRFHDRPMKEWFVSELQEALGSSVHDVQLILNYLDKRGDLDMTRVGMFADGSGASIAIMAAAVDQRIKTLDLFGAWGDWPDWLAYSTLVPDDERAAYLKPEFLKNVENLDPIKWLNRLKTQRVRLQYLQNDTITPKAARERMEAAAPPNAKVVRYDNTKAFVQTVGVNGTKMFDWIKEEIVPGSVAQDAPTGNSRQSAPEAKATVSKSNSTR